MGQGTVKTRDLGQPCFLCSRFLESNVYRESGQLGLMKNDSRKSLANPGAVAALRGERDVGWHYPNSIAVY